MVRSVTSKLMGDPAPGRSAQDRLAEPVRARVVAVTRPEGIKRTPPTPFPPEAPKPPEQPAIADIGIAITEPNQALAVAVPEAPSVANEVSAQIGQLRPVTAICTKGLAPHAPPTGEPIFERVDPAELLIEEAYQRDLSDKSIALIRKIIEEWDWRRFKPPVVAFAEGGLQIIDGQHTAIAAASHPHIDKIPVMVVEAPELATRALAFIGHNRDRLTVSPIQLHHAAVAAGDVTAGAVERVCAKAGVTLVRKAFGGYRWKVGDSVAVGAIGGLLARVGERRAVDILEALVLAEAAPVAANDIKAAEMLFTHADYAEQLNPLSDGGAADLAGAIKALGDTAGREAKVFAAAQCVPYWRALGVVWFRKCRKRRRAA